MGRAGREAPGTALLADLMADLEAGRAELSVPPVRIEVPPGRLPDEGAAALHEAARVLRGALVLGVAWERPPSPGERARAAALAEATGTALDLSLPAPDPSPPPGREALRLHRIQWRTDLDRLLAPGLVGDLERNVAERIRGRAVVRLAWRRGDAERVEEVLLPALRGPLEVHVVPEPGPDGEDALRAGPGLLAQARALGAPLSVRGLAPPAASGYGRTPLTAALVYAGLRELFRWRPSLCPFPFLMLRLLASGGFAPCPNPDGPDPAGADGGDPWNGPGWRGLREAFLAGRPPEACRGCPVFPRVLRSLAAPVPRPADP